MDIFVQKQTYSALMKLRHKDTKDTKHIHRKFKRDLSVAEKEGQSHKRT